MQVDTLKIYRKRSGSQISDTLPARLTKPTMNQNQTIALSAFAGVIATAAFFALMNFFEARTDALNASVDAYRECVIREYGGHTPEEMREATGEYPTCE